MQIILAESYSRSTIAGVTEDEAGVVPYLKEYLTLVQLGHEVPHTFRVYAFNPKTLYVDHLSARVYPVVRESISKWHLWEAEGDQNASTTRS